MRNILKVYRCDMKRLSSNVVAVVIIMGLCVLPSLYAWFNILSNWEPYGADATSHMKIAVYSADEGSNIESISVNIGSNVVEGLKENDSMGWVFTDTKEEAVEGVYSSDYYAALIIPENFTEDMISFLNGDVVHPNIDYYENEKKNAIAPKITSKAKTAVQEQVNSSFVSTLAETLMKVSNSVADGEGASGSITDILESRLTKLDSDLQMYVNLLDSFIGISDSASGLISTTQVMLPNFSRMINYGESSLALMESTVSSGSTGLESAAGIISSGLDGVNANLGTIAALLQSDLSATEGGGSYVNSGTTGANAMMPYVNELYSQTVETWKNQESVRDQVSSIYGQLQQIQTEINQAATDESLSDSDRQALKQQVIDELTVCQSQLSTLKASYETDVKPQLSSAIGSVSQSLDSSGQLLEGVDMDFSDTLNILAKYETALENGTAGLTESKDMALELKAAIEEMILGLDELTESQQYQELVGILETDPGLLGNFVSSPVNLDTQAVYEIENYGSAMAPFYTILALWVGALILVAVIHVKVEKEEGLEDVKPYEKFFGRYLNFFLIGQAQTLITVLGNLFYIKIQCHNPFLFWLACAMCSFVFTLFIYSLTVAMGNVGEAVSVVVMVIQVAGAGGSFPVEVLPKVYQVIYKYLPFPYGMNAMRETIGGMYKNAYWENLRALCIYVVVSLFIGLVLAIPFRKLNKKIEKSKENTDLMI